MSLRVPTVNFRWNDEGLGQQKGMMTRWRAILGSCFSKEQAEEDEVKETKTMKIPAKVKVQTETKMKTKVQECFAQYQISFRFNHEGIQVLQPLELVHAFVFVLVHQTPSLTSSTLSRYRGVRP